MRIVAVMGMAYKVNERSYRKLLQEIADKGEANVEQYGKYLGTVKNLTDMSKEEARSELNDLRS